MNTLVAMFIFFGTGTPAVLSGFADKAACQAAVPDLKKQLPSVTRAECVAVPAQFDIGLPKGEILIPRDFRSPGCGEGCIFN